MTGTVTVACKLPMGIVIREEVERTEKELVMGGGVRDVKVYRPTGKMATIRGCSIPVQRDPNADYPPIVGGAALTFGVDADLWAKWFASNKESDLVRNGLVYAHEKQEMVRGHAKEHAAQKSGLEPLNPAGDPRQPRPSRNVGSVTLADRAA